MSSLTYRLRKLKNQVRRAADDRGHRLGRFTTHPMNDEVAYAQCTICGRAVSVCTDPPTGIMMAGDVLRTKCRRSNFKMARKSL
jgi:hypothetical protein